MGAFIVSLKNKFKTAFNEKEGYFKVLKFIFLFVLVLALLFIFSVDFKSKNKKNVKIKTTLSAMEYCATVENRLINVLGQIKNIGNVDVFVMVDSSPTIKYLEETKTEVTKKEQSEVNSIETQIVLKKDGTITSPIVVVELMPKITGVLIVATGAKDIKLKNALINTVSAILDIKVSKVEVLEGK